MVLKKSKLGRNTGNSFKTFCYRHQINRHGCVAKFFLHESFSQRGNTTDESFEYIPDGGLSSNRSINKELCLIYSLNKHKRWTLHNFIENIIAWGFLDEDDYRVVIRERCLRQQILPILAGTTVGYQMRVLDTVSICDSFSLYKIYADKTFSSFDDLRCRFDDQSSCFTKPRQGETGHTRGVQRKQNLDKRYIENGNER